jgi:hypothetical protein
MPKFTWSAKVPGAVMVLALGPNTEERKDILSADLEPVEIDVTLEMKPREVPKMALAFAKNVTTIRDAVTDISAWINDEPVTETPDDLLNQQKDDA